GGTTVNTTGGQASGRVDKDTALIVGGVLAVVGLFGDKLIGTKTEREIGKSAAKAALQKYPVYRGDPRVQQYVQGVVDRLAANRERKDVQYEIKVVESNEINAFAVPGGYMFITTGALKAMKSEAELAGVLGHEMAHIEKRHGIKSLQNQLVGMGIAIAALGSTESQEVQAAGAVALGLALKGCSRGHESEADSDGCRLAAKAGYDPRGLTSFLQTVKQQERPGVELLSDHPETAKRIKAINKQIDQEKLLTVQMDQGVDRYNQQVYWLRRGY
ncbi:MAG: M48 family metalloprotease, partial [Candidatus Sericytochromatia bacterium]|nr:M48 family metalloprotease [Candidatus Tanganyikabacteria bacterium]